MLEILEVVLKGEGVFFVYVCKNVEEMFYKVKQNVEDVKKEFEL